MATINDLPTDIMTLVQSYAPTYEPSVIVILAFSMETGQCQRNNISLQHHESGNVVLTVREESIGGVCAGLIERQTALVPRRLDTLMWLIKNQVMKIRHLGCARAKLVSLSEFNESCNEVRSTMVDNSALSIDVDLWDDRAKQWKNDDLEQLLAMWIAGVELGTSLTFQRGRDRSIVGADQKSKAYEHLERDT